MHNVLDNVFVYLFLRKDNRLLNNMQGVCKNIY